MDMVTAKYRMLESRYYQDRLPLVALDYYDRDSHGEDDFSRKQIWFYTYGDDEIEREFGRSLKAVFKKLFLQDDKEWDLITLYPSHTQGDINSNMISLILDISRETGIPFEQVIRRTETVSQNHEIEKEKAKVVNLEGSIEARKDLNGKNVILVDNIVLSGVSMLNGASALRNEGADNVFSIALGTSISHDNDTSELNGDRTASDLMKS